MKDKKRGGQKSIEARKQQSRWSKRDEDAEHFPMSTSYSTKGGKRQATDESRACGAVYLARTREASGRASGRKASLRLLCPIHIRWAYVYLYGPQQRSMGRVAAKWDGQVSVSQALLDPYVQVDRTELLAVGFGWQGELCLPRGKNNKYNNFKWPGSKR